MLLHISTIIDHILRIDMYCISIYSWIFSTKKTDCSFFPWHTSFSRSSFSPFHEACLSSPCWQSYTATPLMKKGVPSFSMLCLASNVESFALSCQITLWPFNVGSIIIDMQTGLWQFLCKAIYSLLRYASQKYLETLVPMVVYPKSSITLPTPGGGPL